MELSIAIDGPSGAGKSTVARLVASGLGLVYVDTGAMYRAVALACINRGIDLNDEGAVTQAAETLAIDIAHGADGAQRLLLDGCDVTERLRARDTAEGASLAARYGGVRARLVAMQKALASRRSVIMDGRDIGTHVLPDAPLKVYLDAGLGTRARRRLNDLAAQGSDADLDTIIEEIAARDERDRSREHAPLIRAADAVYINTDGLDARGVADEIERLAHTVLQGR
jgi:cytidylate kinase